MQAAASASLWLRASVGASCEPEIVGERGGEMTLRWTQAEGGREGGMEGGRKGGGREEEGRRKGGGREEEGRERGREGGWERKGKGEVMCVCMRVKERWGDRMCINVHCTVR